MEAIISLFLYTQHTFSYAAYVRQRSLTTRSLCLSLETHSSTTLAQFTLALSLPLRLSLFRNPANIAFSFQSDLRSRPSV